MKKIILILIIIMLHFPTFAEVLQGGVSYDVNSAREELLRFSDKKIDKTLVQSFYRDYYYNENQTYKLSANKNPANRVLAFFSDTTYGVMYNAIPLYVWYYSKNGTLIYMEKKDSTEYPYKTYKYTPSGLLMNMSLRVSKEEAFVFTPAGKLIAHWIGPNAYDEENNVIMTREYKE